MLTWTDFEKIDMRIGTIIDVKNFPKAHNPSFQLWIDFGDLGIKKSSAQITELYNREDLIGLQIVAVVNFPPKQIANFVSECLVLGGVQDNSLGTVLLSVEKGAKNGTRVL